MIARYQNGTNRDVNSLGVNVYFPLVCVSEATKLSNETVPHGDLEVEDVNLLSKQCVIRALASK